ncbi:MAG: hypothetical protein M5U12_17135 [Verrucomicrobia bacterium]|nr:hypothetical protein [Verrucomicrobiota bacterium]
MGEEMLPVTAMTDFQRNRHRLCGVMLPSPDRTVEGLIGWHEEDLK